MTVKLKIIASSPAPTLTVVYSSKEERQKSIARITTICSSPELEGGVLSKEVAWSLLSMKTLSQDKLKRLENYLMTVLTENLLFGGENEPLWESLVKVIAEKAGEIAVIKGPPTPTERNNLFEDGIRDILRACRNFTADSSLESMSPEDVDWIHGVWQTAVKNITKHTTDTLGELMLKIIQAAKQNNLDTVRLLSKEINQILKDLITQESKIDTVQLEGRLKKQLGSQFQESFDSAAFVIQVEETAKTANTLPEKTIYDLKLNPHHQKTDRATCIKRLALLLHYPEIWEQLFFLTYNNDVKLTKEQAEAKSEKLSKQRLGVLVSTIPELTKRALIGYLATGVLGVSSVASWPVLSIILVGMLANTALEGREGAVGRSKAENASMAVKAAAYFAVYGKETAIISLLFSVPSLVRDAHLQWSLSRDIPVGDRRRGELDNIREKQEETDTHILKVRQAEIAKTSWTDWMLSHVMLEVGNQPVLKAMEDRENKSVKKPNRHLTPFTYARQARNERFSNMFATLRSFAWPATVVVAETIGKVVEVLIYNTVITAGKEGLKAAFGVGQTRLEEIGLSRLSGKNATEVMELIDQHYDSQYKSQPCPPDLLGQIAELKEAAAIELLAPPEGWLSWSLSWMGINSDAVYASHNLSTTVEQGLTDLKAQYDSKVSGLDPKGPTAMALASAKDKLVTGLINLVKDEDASVLKSLYKRLAAKYHPDKETGDAGMFKIIATLRPVVVQKEDPITPTHEVKATDLAVFASPVGNQGVCPIPDHADKIGEIPTERDGDIFWDASESLA